MLQKDRRYWRSQFYLTLNNFTGSVFIDAISAVIYGSMLDLMKLAYLQRKMVGH